MCSFDNDDNNDHDAAPQMEERGIIMCSETIPLIEHWEVNHRKTWYLLKKKSAVFEVKTLG